MKKKAYIVPVYGTSVLRRNESKVQLDNGIVIEKKSHKAGGIDIPVPFRKEPGTNKMITGLDELVENPWHEDMKPDYVNLGSYWRDKENYLKSRESITLQEYLEIEYNLKPGTLDDTSGVKTMAELHLKPRREFENQKPSMIDDFYKRFSFDHITTLDAGKSLEDALAIQLAENQPSIFAPNRESVNKNKHSFWIAYEEDDIEVIRTERKQMQKAVSQLEDMQTNNSDFTLYQMSVILEIIKGNATTKQVNSALEDYLWMPKKTEYGTQSTRVLKFKERYNLLKKDAVAFEVEYMFRQALNSGVFKINKADNSIYWTSQRGVDNFYNLGRNIKNIKGRIYKERASFDEALDTDNMYGMLYEDLQNNNIKLG